MKELKIVFTKSKKKFAIGSWLIRMWTKQPYSHVARAVEIRDWGYRYFQASEGKVNYEFEKFFLKKHTIVKSYTISIPKDLDRQIKKQCYFEAGNKYGTMQNVGIFLKDLGIFKETPWKSGRNCSELIFLEVFKQLVPDLKNDPDTIKPHEVEEIIKTHFNEVNGKWVLNTAL